TEPRRLLIVIDLNGTVLYRPTYKNPDCFKKRPQVKDFIKYLFDNFAVMVWSSAKQINADAMCRNLLTAEQQERLVAKVGRDNDLNDDVQAFKRLKDIWSGSFPAITDPGQWNQSNTVLIDTSLQSAKSEPYNAIAIPAFRSGLPEQERDKDVLQNVKKYLEILCTINNVSRYLRMYPFEVEDEARNHKRPANATVLP
ncbi:HAD-like protein, partial [Viridothelium virens]